MKALIIGVSNPSGLALLKTLSAAGVDLHAADTHRHAPGMSLVKRWHRLVLPPTSPQEQVDAIIRHCLKKRIQVVIPAIDGILDALSENAEEFEQRAIRLMVPSDATRALCADRVEFFRAMEAVVPTPRYAVFDEAFDPSDWLFPLVLRPRHAGGEFESRMFVSIEDLSRVSRDARLMVEEPMAGEVSYVDIMSSQDGQVLAAVPRTEYRDAANRPVAMTLHDERLEAYGRRVAQVAEVRYAASIEFRRLGKGPLMVTGLVPRSTGATMLTARSGVNIPLLCLKEVLGEPITRDELRFKEVGMIRRPSNAIQVGRRRGGRSQAVFA